MIVNEFNDRSLKIEAFIRRMIARVPATELVAETRELDLDEVGTYGRTPLMVAAAAGLVDLMQVLVKSGASVGATGQAKMTALHEASANGQVAAAKYLLSLGAEVDAETKDGGTPLMCAAAWGFIESAKLLLDKCADPAKTDNRGATAVDVAREKGEDDAADFIEAYSPGEAA
jgi:ankyrin repeat protein